MTSKPLRTFRLFVLRWHRRVGVALSLIVVWICLSGLLLNHIHAWGIADKLIAQPWLAAQYNVVEPRYYRIDEQRWLVQQASGEIVFDKSSVGQCDTPLLGIAKTDHIYAIACANSLFLTLADGGLLEHIAPAQGLPKHLAGVGQIGNKIALQSAQQWYVFDDEAFEFSATTDTVSVQAPDQPPATVQQYYSGLAQLPQISIERLLLDLHTGAFWGESKTLVSDIAAILLILIAVGGVWVWLTKPGRFR